MRIITQLCKDIKLPRMIRVKQLFQDDFIAVEEIPDVVHRQMKRQMKDIQPGMRIAITAGSRGVANIVVILRAISDFIKQCSACPFIVAAMGSHGGATADGQRQVLEDLGITEAAVGCPIVSSMETIYIGDTANGESVYVDRHAAKADGIVVCGRIKAHTSFRGEYESGLMKMMVVGLGKQRGADAFHAAGIEHMGKRIYPFGKAIVDNCKILCGVGVIENAYEKTCKIVSLDAKDIPEQEPALLLEAKSRMGRLFFEMADVIVVDQMGKNISGDGMDPNITGKYPSPYLSGPISSQHLVVLDLTDESHGNANGLGCANVSTRRLHDKMDMEVTYPNAITSTAIWAVKIPMIAANDKEAVQIAVRACTGIDKQHVRIIRIKNTLEIDEILISESLLEDACKEPQLTIAGTGEEWNFDREGNLW